MSLAAPVTGIQETRMELVHATQQHEGNLHNQQKAQESWRQNGNLVRNLALMPPLAAHFALSREGLDNPGVDGVWTSTLAACKAARH